MHNGAPAVVRQMLGQGSESDFVEITDDART